MPQVRAIYSVVQYVPDGARAEAANAGVVLYVPSQNWLDVETSPTLERVRQFFHPDPRELRRLELYLSALKSRMGLARQEFASEQDLIQFAAARADTMRLTAPRLVMVEDPRAALASLYSELVGDRERRVAPTPPLPPRVAEVFARLEANRKIWRPRPIVIPALKRRILIPLAFENGQVNYLKPESLAPERKHTLQKRLTQLGFNGQLIHQHPVDSKPGQLVVLSSDAKADPDEEQLFQQTLKDFHVRFVPFQQADDFAAEVEETAH